MKSITNQTKQTIKLEEKKNSGDNKFAELKKLLTQIDKLGYSEKPNYSLPLVDTIGKTIPILNKHSI